MKLKFLMTAKGMPAYFYDVDENTFYFKERPALNGDKDPVLTYTLHKRTVGDDYWEWLPER